MPFLRFLLALPSSITMAVIIYLPGDAGLLLRRWHYGRRLRRCGKRLVVQPGVHIDNPPCVEIGDNVIIRENAIIRTSLPRDDDPRDCRWTSTPTPDTPPGIITIGNNSSIAFNAILLGYGGIRIGEKCGVGPGSIILSESYHHKGTDPKRIYKYSRGADPQEQCVLRGFVELKDGAGVSSRVVVLPGAVIGYDSWIGPNSVVRIGAKIDKHVILKGDPAKTIMRRTFR